MNKTQDAELIIMCCNWTYRGSITVWNVGYKKGKTRRFTGLAAYYLI